MIPRMLLLVSVEDRALPPAHRRAIAFSLSRILTSDDHPTLQKLSSELALTMLHDPILHGESQFVWRYAGVLIICCAQGVGICL